MAAFTISSRSVCPVEPRAQSSSVSSSKSTFSGATLKCTSPQRSVTLASRPQKLYVEAGAKKSRCDVEDVVKYGNSEKDCGSTAIQIAFLTSRITNLTEHLKIHKKDYATQRGLQMILGKRRRLLNYLFQSDREKFVEVVTGCNIRTKLI